MSRSSAPRRSGQQVSRRRAAPATRRPSGASGGRGSRPGGQHPRPGDPTVRQRWLIVAAAIVLVLFVGRLVQVQVIQGPALASTAQQDRLATEVTVAGRGDVLDVNGTVVATSVDRYTIVADQLWIQSFRANGRHVDGEPVQDGALGIAQLLGPVLGQSPASLAAQLNGERRYVVLARDVVPEVQRAVAALGLRAYVRTDMTSQRTYPAGTVGGALWGFLDAEQTGQGGIEAAYDELLAGTDGTFTYEQGRDGVPIPASEIESVPAEPGHDVQLTIDLDVQWKAEDLIDEAVRSTGADHGIAMVQDVRTGEIVALAESGSVDPNDRSSAAVADGSRAVQDIFEPGSTGKVISMAAALEGGMWEPTDQFEVPDRYTLDGEVFRDSSSHPVERWTLAGIFAQSSNTGTVMMGEKIPVAVRHDYLRKFGFGERTGIGLPGESRGMLPAEDDAHDRRTKHAILFGQGVAVNAIQATQVFSTVANDGVRMPATLLAGTRTPQGEVVPAERPEGTQVVSAETAQTLVTMMEAAVSEDGTGWRAQVPGYRVAGKTGTSQMFTGGRTAYVASFIGVAPADDPRYTVGVFVNQPRSSIWGGVVAAPVFSDLMGYVLRKEGVPPSTEEADLYPVTW